MLQLRPNCECCDKDLPPEATDAFICSYECTYCRTCAEDVLANVCQNCGGNLTQRPIRPREERGEGLSLAKHPASTKRVHSTRSREEVAAFVEAVKNVPPEQR